LDNEDFNIQTRLLIRIREDMRVAVYLCRASSRGRIDCASGAIFAICLDEPSRVARITHDAKHTKA
jgi:hypothetical protein